MSNEWGPPPRAKTSALKLFGIFAAVALCVATLAAGIVAAADEEPPLLLLISTPLPSAVPIAAQKVIPTAIPGVARAPRTTPAVNDSWKLRAKPKAGPIEKSTVIALPENPYAKK